MLEGGVGQQTPWHNLQLLSPPYLWLPGGCGWWRGWGPEGLLVGLARHRRRQRGRRKGRGRSQTGGHGAAIARQALVCPAAAAAADAAVQAGGCAGWLPLDRAGCALLHRCATAQQHSRRAQRLPVGGSERLACRPGKAGVGGSGPGITDGLARGAVLRWQRRQQEEAAVLSAAAGRQRRRARGATHYVSGAARLGAPPAHVLTITPSWVPAGPGAGCRRRQNPL